MKIAPKTVHFKTCDESLKGKTTLLSKKTLFFFIYFVVIRDLVQGFL